MIIEIQAYKTVRKTDQGYLEIHRRDINTEKHTEKGTLAGKDAEYVRSTFNVISQCCMERHCISALSTLLVDDFACLLLGRFFLALGETRSIIIAHSDVYCCRVHVFYFSRFSVLDYERLDGNSFRKFLAFDLRQ